MPDTKMPSVPVWQVGTGDDARPYAAWMLEHNLVAVGSGWAGRWPNAKYGPSPALRSFAEDARPGDLVIAKHGTQTALALGVLGGYDFDKDLETEDWDLCHFRRVRWLTHEEHHFNRRALARARFCRCKDPEALAWVSRTIKGDSLEPPDAASMPPLPSLGPHLPLTSLPPELRRILKKARAWHHNWYHEDLWTIRPTESELIAHITIPLFEALGWPAGQIAVGWQYADVPLFADLERSNESCRVIVEAKRLGDGLLWAQDQAHHYASKLGHPVDTIVTDGLRYELARAAGGDLLTASLANPRETAAAFFDALRYRRAPE